MRNLAKVEVLLPNEEEQKIDDLLIFDARCLDVPTRQELLRLLPRLVHLRRAWRAHYSEHGCLGCQKPEPTVAIAARLRRRRMSWAEIYEVMGINRASASRKDRKKFEHAVAWRMAHLDLPEREPSHRYGAGGFCDRCYLRIRGELATILRRMHADRNAMEETAALTRKFDVAQWLLNGDLEEPDFDHK